MKIGIITFHGAYNFGSVLQAYALQTYLEKNSNCKCEIINYRSLEQYRLYHYPWKRYEILPIYLVKLILLRSRKEKQNRFETFMRDYLHLTDEINNADMLTAENLQYDIYICGSDQIWNFRAPDATEAYYLPLISGKVKVSYSASFGGGMDFSKYQSKQNQALMYIKDYKLLSVREKAAADFLYKKTGRSAEVLLDPTLLLSMNDWDLLAFSDLNLKPEQYVFFYTIGYTQEVRKMALDVGKKYKVPVVIAQLLHCTEIFDNQLIKVATAGPNDFLWLIKNAKCVFTTSFHGTAFSIIFHKEFWSYVGVKDERKTTLLKTVDLEERAIFTTDCFKDKLINSKPINWDQVDKRILKKAEQTYAFFKKAFEVTEND